MTHLRAVPGFFLDWRSQWVGPAPLAPVAYLDQPESLRVVLMAQWLFCPELVEYRGGVFVAGRFSARNVDDWLANLQYTVPVVEEVVNRVKLWDVFMNTDLEGYDRYLQDLAVSLQACWRGVLATRFPGREFVVVVEDEESGGYGPGVTFFSTAS